MKRLVIIATFLTAFLGFGCEGDYTIYDMHPPPEIIEVEVEVIVEVLVEVPGEGGDVWVDSFDQPYTINGVDIVWLIDKSGSMNSHAQSVVDGIEAMMLSLPPSGWRLGITSTAWQTAGNASQFPLVPGDTVQDAWDAYNNTGNYGLEAGFDALYAYLIESSYNQSWLRPDAGLLVVFVSDEEEQSNRDFAFTNPGLLDFINWYGSQRQSVFMASIVNVHSTENECDGTVSPYFLGQRYIDATNAFGGVIVDICSDDWAPGVQAATTQIEPHEEWELTFTPIEETLIVFVDSVAMPANEWQYSAATNSVEFLVIPPEGSHVEIGYVIDYTPGDDDDSSGDDDDSASP